MSFLLKLSFCILFLFHFVTILKANTTPPSSKWLEPYRVTITNHDVPVVVVGCDDRGAEIIRPGQSTSWKFRMNFFGTTSYNCRFYWLEQTGSYNVNKAVSFPVFDDEIVKLCGSSLANMNRCYWMIDRIAFYFSNTTDGSFPNDDAWRVMHVWSYG
ncbi:putative plant self-incompatibility S1 [Helianthus annuus]|uniref:Plant self-incompatibility S1 n=1 Tax=Helianthus annuus TaxID=4232 RepID=A0A9K3EMA4_HELAN|nr:putative plant self-incompatibility S1 [Helianthus annuus]KAJ0478707.1 putative plant self-incompatibility S1 [Helianthus annuus]KAJ0499589.1 putative plant self-incompatibility S1 [Helianthus annuus]KAJ0665601.1 putative plant self-incompatibility S1 [Helianthus annuus]